ncbi:MAG TPA: rhodanese-like domain-containing protein, partial [bacterium]
VGYEKRFNASILAASNGEGAFVDSILADQKAPPLYFGRMKKLNKEGPPVLGDIPDPEQLILEELKNYIGNSDYAILDTRMSRQQFFAGHIPGSMFTPLNPTFPTITGSYVDPDQKIILIIEENKVKDAVLGLIHIGLDNVIGWCDTGIIDEYAKSAGELGSIESIDWETFDERGGSNGSFLLDCRYDNEYEEGHVPDAYNIPHTRLAVRADELPRDRHVIIYCRTGSRASSAASYLKCHGFEVTHVDDLINRWFANNRV